MKKLCAYTLALCAATSFSYAQETVTSEKTEVKTNAAGTSSKTTTKVTTDAYVDQMRTVYTSAGIPQTKTERLIQLDRQLFEAYRAGDVEAVRRIRLEIRSLLGEDITKVHTYIEAHPLPATYPGFVVNTYAPESAFTRDITFSTSGASGVNVNRAGTAGSVSGSTNVNTTNRSATEANVSGSAGTNAQGTVNTQGSVNTNTQGSNANQGTSNQSTPSSGATGSGTSGATGSSGSSSNSNNN